MLALVFALLLGHALPRWVAALAGSRRRVVGAIVVIGSLVAGWALPALSGNLYTSPVDVPDYWHEAAQAVDGAGHDSRVLLLPNQVRASYRWTDERPDDVTNSVMRRGAIIPESSPNASAPGANFLSALGDLVASGSAEVRHPQQPGIGPKHRCRDLGPDSGGLLPARVMPVKVIWPVTGRLEAADTVINHIRGQLSALKIHPIFCA